MTWRIEVTEAELVRMSLDWDDVIIPILITLSRYNNMRSWHDEGRRRMVIEGDYTFSLDPAIHRERLGA